MPELLIHVAVPLFVLILVGVEPKKALPLALLGAIPDADVLFHIHRSMSHSALVILAPCIPAIIFTHFKAKGHFNDAVIATLVLLSHPFMDMFTGLTPILWPAFNKSIFITAEMTANMNDVSDLHLFFNLKLAPVVFYPTADEDAPIFTSEGVAVCAILLASSLFKICNDRNRWQNRRFILIK